MILQKEATHIISINAPVTSVALRTGMSVFVNTLLIPESPTMTADGGKSERGWL